MRVKVQLFAIARDLAESDSAIVSLPADATVWQLRAALAAEYPALAKLLPHVRIAVDSNYAADSQVISATAEIALIPPVSGG